MILTAAIVLAVMMMITVTPAAVVVVVIVFMLIFSYHHTANALEVPSELNVLKHVGRAVCLFISIIFQLFTMSQTKTGCLRG